MANELATGGKISPEGRVVIPASIRRVLDVGPGDRVEFIVEDGQVRVMTPRMRANELWANNPGGDGSGDAARDVRAARSRDQRTAQERWTRVDAAVAASTEADTDELTATLLGAVGFVV